MSPGKPVDFPTAPRKRYSGSTLVVSLCVLFLLIGFMGIGVFVGVQAYLQAELQKAADASVMVGASEMYASTGSNLPILDAAAGTTATNQTFQAVLKSSPALQGFNAAISAGPTVDQDERSIRLNVVGYIPTPFLTLAGIRQIDMQVEAKAQALKMQPTNMPGQNIYIRPSGSPTLDPSSAFQQTASNFPIVDRTGNDIYVEQGQNKKGYQVEACTATDCYQLGPGAVAVGGGSPWPTSDHNIVYGDILIDLSKVGVKKAASIKISDDGEYYSVVGDKKFIDLRNDDLVLGGISVFGYSALCPSNQPCQSVPLGYAKY